MSDAAEGRQVRNYVYGLLPPTENAQRVEDELSAAHRYYNAIIELERRRRAEYRELMSRHPDVARLEGETATLVDEANGIFQAAAAASAQQGKKTLLSATDKQRYGELKKLLAAKRSELKQAKAKLKADTQLAKARVVLSDAHKARLKEAYNAAPLYWATRLSTGAAAEAATQTKLEPRFRRWDGTGRISVQCQGGLSTNEVFDVDNTLVRLEVVDAERAFTRRGAPATAGSGRRQAQRTRLHFRVGSTETSQPIWATFPCILHRPLPDGRIKWVHILRDRVADRPVWRVMFTVETHAAVPPQPPRAGVVGVDLCWRKRPDGSLRVAYLVDDAGRARELTLPGHMLRSQQRLSEIASLRATAFDDAKRLLKDWWATAPSVELKTRAGVTIDMSAIHTWRNPSRIVTLLSANAGLLPQPLKGALERFVERDLRRWRATEARRGRARRRRDELQDAWAREIGDAYGTVALSRVRVSELVLHAVPGVRTSAEVASRNRLRSFAALSGFVDRLKRRANVIELDGASATRTCAACGFVNPSWGEELEATCAACGVTTDVDANAAAILVAMSGTVGVTPRKNPTATKSRRLVRFEAAAAQRRAAKTE